MKIIVKFSPYCKLSEVEVYELRSYEEFFRFYAKNHNKGVIYGVKEVNE
jgi:hypothetical protein